MARVSEIAAFLDELLRTNDVPDYPGAMNGLQVDGSKDVRRVAAAVDFSSVTVRAAVHADTQMLLVHHGMFWSEQQRIVGQRYEQVAALIQNGLAIYSSHLPLDLHPELGNNVLLAHTLDLQPSAGFARYQGVEIGVSGCVEVRTAELVARVQRFATGLGSSVIATPFSSDRLTRNWAICTGAGANSNTLREAMERDIDTMIVGEGPHHTAVEARDLGIVIIYAGHYATETLGIGALSERVAREFGLESIFLAAPTGL